MNVKMRRARMWKSQSADTGLQTPNAWTFSQTRALFLQVWTPVIADKESHVPGQTPLSTASNSMSLNGTATSNRCDMGLMRGDLQVKESSILNVFSFTTT